MQRSNSLKRIGLSYDESLKALKDFSDEDLIMLSDNDEIPNLSSDQFNKSQKDIILFKQLFFYFKFNLLYDRMFWIGTKACKKKKLKSLSWLRNIKLKKYPFWRLDTLFSETKQINLDIIEDGGWHFTNLKNAKEIEYKLKSYLHHREFDVNPISSDEIRRIMNDKIAIYDLSLDKKTQKIGHGKKLQKYSLEKLPKFLQNNIVNYQEWID